MNPALLMKLGLGGIAAYLAWQYLQSKKQPKPSDYQSVTVPTANGVPMTIATPVAPTITEAQATGSVSIPIPTAIPIPIPGYGQVPDYASASNFVASSAAAPVVMPSATPILAPTVAPPPPSISIPISPPGPPPPPVPITTNDGTVFAPPNTVQVTSSGDVTQPAPIVVTPGGSSSIAVGNTLDVQRALNTLGYTPRLDEDGKLGPKTTANIKAFQSKSHLTTDGIAGPATKVALSAALTLMAGAGSLAGATAQFSAPQTGIATTPTGATINTAPALQWGTRDIQHALNRLGARPQLAEDGQSGPKTVAAVKSFQTANGLSPDGVAGPKTKTALFIAMSQLPATGVAV